MGRAVEYDLALIQDEELSAVVNAAVGNRLYFAGLLTEVVSGQQEGVLEAVGYEQRCCVGDVALLDCRRLDDRG